MKQISMAALSRKTGLRQGSAHSVRCLALSCVISLLYTAAHAQASGTLQTAASAPKMLTIEIIEGEAELNDVRARTAREPIVQINDENHKPVAGALVLFSIQSGGGQPGATFAGLANYSTRTDALGRAVGRGFKPTKHTGNYQIQVQALFAGATAAAEIHETNIAKGSRISRLTTNHTTLVTVLDAAAAAAVVSTILITSHDPSTTTLTVGTGTVTGR